MGRPEHTQQAVNGFFIAVIAVVAVDLLFLLAVAVLLLLFPSVTLHVMSFGLSTSINT